MASAAPPPRLTPRIPDAGAVDGRLVRLPGSIILMVELE